MACIELCRKTGNYRVKIRLKGYPSISRTFTRKDFAIAWADIAETDMKMARHAAALQKLPATLKETA